MSEMLSMGEFGKMAQEWEKRGVDDGELEIEFW